jgi:hypothetical protein
MSDQKESASAHFVVCGPFCDHVVFCDECIDAYGTCEDHKDDPNGSVIWKCERKDEE